jgi:hypothetical protein
MPGNDRPWQHQPLESFELRFSGHRREQCRHCNQPADTVPP